MKRTFPSDNLLLIVNFPQTPLNNSPNGSFTLALKVMALVRILLKDINIPATTAMETLNADGQIIALQSGANVVMPNVNLLKYSEKYQIYPNKKISNSSTIDDKKHIEMKIKKINRSISKDYGNHIPRKNHKIID